MRELVVGTRGSTLALTQTESVCAALRAIEPGLRIRVERITTTGDARADVPLSVLGRGVFVSEIEAALRAKRIDFAVHSAKDLPSTLGGDLALAAFPAREDARDVLVSRHGTLRELPAGTRVGTSSPRRVSQLRALRPDLELRDMRGNVDTRLRKLMAGDYDAIVLAAAGLIRLGRADVVTEWLPAATIIPCVGQGALAVEARTDDAELLRLLSRLDDARTRASVLAERAFLAELGAGCLAAVAAHATLDVDGDRLALRAMIGDTTGRRDIRASAGPTRDAAGIGTRLARAMLREGAARFLSRADGPLSNRRVVVTRPAAQSREVVALLEARGAVVSAHPTIAIEPPADGAPLEEALREIDSFDWIVFTSANAARSVAASLTRLSLAMPADLKVAAIGQGTANEVADLLGTVDFIASEARADAVGHELPVTDGTRVLFPRGDRASAALGGQLRRRGARVTEVVAYRTVPGAGVRDLSETLAGDEVSAILFASPSSARFAADALEPARYAGSVPSLVCIGRTTALALTGLGFEVAAIATTPATGAVVEAIERAVAAAVRATS